MRPTQIFTSLRFCLALMAAMLMCAAPPMLYGAGYEAADPFELADLQTGSARFTNSNEVELVDLPIPEGYDRFQFTEDGDPQSLDGWSPTSAVPATVEFDQPSADAEVTLYAWFTNATDSVALRRAEQSIIYTETPPDPASLNALTLETPGFSVRITGADILGDTTGGTAIGEPMGIHSLEAIWESGDFPDLTPDDPFVTLTNAGVYAVKLRVVNEAGNVAESTTACTVTLQAPAKPLPEGDRYVVAHNLNAKAPYTNWVTAASSIQTAVNATTADGETLLVWPGRYTVPTNAVSGDGVLNVANITRPLTLRAVAGKAHTLIDGEGANRGLRINYSATSPPFVLDGFTVTNGFAANGGGVIYASGNKESHYLNNLFVANVAEDSGGAMRDSSGSTIVISNSVFRQNHALHDTQNNRGGGAVYKTSGSIAIYDSLFEGNRANANTLTTGGAIYIQGGVIERTIFRDNRSHLSGNAVSGGGAINARDHLVVRNSLFHDNAGHRGGAIYLPSSDRNITIENCTITRNHSGSAHTQNSAGGIWNRNGRWDMRIYNSIIIGNTGGPNINYSDDTDTVTELLHSCTSLKRVHPDGDAGFDADGNITDAPLFVDPDAGNFRLSRESPCINTGTPRDWHDGAVDLAGKRRVDAIYNQVDMGAYEYQYPATIILIR